jgi:hypothetical protein
MKNVTNNHIITVQPLNGAFIDRYDVNPDFGRILLVQEDGMRMTLRGEVRVLEHVLETSAVTDPARPHVLTMPGVIHMTEYLEGDVPDRLRMTFDFDRTSREELLARVGKHHAYDPEMPLLTCGREHIMCFPQYMPTDLVPVHSIVHHNNQDEVLEILEALGIDPAAPKGPDRFATAPRMIHAKLPEPDMVQVSAFVHSKVREIKRELPGPRDTSPLSQAYADTLATYTVYGYTEYVHACVRKGLKFCPRIR